MTSTTQEIFNRFEIRKSRKQKTAFTNWIRPILEQAGYPVKIETGSMNCRNIVIGDPDRAEVVFTAHYDTCAVMPFPNFITPKKPLYYWLYQILIMIPIFGFIFAVSWMFSLMGEGMFLVGYWLAFGCFMIFMVAGPANKHTANDNTSGVTAVIDLALAMPEELREDAAFVLFDFEEIGLVGSSDFAKRHKDAIKDKLLVNLDCVSDGETVLFVLKKGAHSHLDRLKEAFSSDSRVTADFATKGFVYPSDQKPFPVGVGVCALNRSKRGLLYMDKIHTGKDTIYREENIQWLVEGCIRLTEHMEATHEAV